MKSCCIVIPAYQPEEAMIGYVSALLAALDGPVVVVDDGSGASYGAVFGRVESMERCTVLRHGENRGKGAAIRTAAAWYLENAAGCSGIITADCDGQHTVRDVVKIAAEMAREEEHRQGDKSEQGHRQGDRSGQGHRQGDRSGQGHRQGDRSEQEHWQGHKAEPESRSLILGCRTFGAGTPGKSAVGNRLISTGMRLFYGVDLEDTQTGLRGIPEELLPDLLRLKGDRYEYELNMLIYARQVGIPFSVVPIETIYFNENKGSHYRAVADSARIFAGLCGGLVQYGLSSALSAAVDVAMYAVLIKWALAFLPFAQRLFLAALLARVVSSVVNFSCNRRLPGMQEKRIFPTMIRYYALWSVQLAASIVMVWLFCTGAGMDELLAKLATDLLLSVCSYQVQLRWVFRHSEENGRKENVCLQSVCPGVSSGGPENGAAGLEG